MDTLDFINTSSNEDLRTLCDIITLDKDGSPRLTEELTGTAGYRMNYPGNMRALAPEMVDEFRRFGGNTFANIVRGEGPEYSEILRDVAKRQKVKIKSGDSDEVIERHLLEKMFDNISKTMTDEQLKEMMDQMAFISSTTHARLRSRRFNWLFGKEGSLVTSGLLWSRMR